MMKSSVPVLAAIMASALTLVSSASAATWEINPVHSNIIYRVSYLDVVTHHGFLTEFSGAVTFDKDAIERSSIAITAQAASLNSLHEARNEQLRSEDFFHTERFPTIAFKSTKWERTGNKTFDVTGLFSLHGVEREIVVPVTFNGTAENQHGQIVAGFDATFTIKRSEYGMYFAHGILGDEVTLIIAIEGIRKANNKADR